MSDSSDIVDPSVQPPTKLVPTASPTRTTGTAACRTHPHWVVTDLCRSSRRLVPGGATGERYSFRGSSDVARRAEGGRPHPPGPDAHRRAPEVPRSPTCRSGSGAKRRGATFPKCAPYRRTPELLVPVGSTQRSSRSSTRAIMCTRSHRRLRCSTTSASTVMARRRTRAVAWRRH